MRPTIAVTIAPLIALAASCRTPAGDADDVRPDAPAPQGDTDVRYADSDVVDTELPAPPDSDPVAAHTDDTGVVAPVDTDVVPDPWTGGLVDVTGPMDGPLALVPHPGHPNGGGLAGPQPMSISIGDLDEDGLPEVIVGAGSFGTDGVLGHRVYHWNGTDLEPSYRITLPTLRGAVVGVIDLDGDGHLDLVANDMGYTVAFGRGDGSFRRAIGVDPAAAAPLATQVVPWDVDGDGWLDLLVSGDCGVGMVYALRTGARTWRIVRDHTVEVGPAVQSAAPMPVPTPDGTLIYTSGSACDLLDPHPGFYRVEDGGPGGPSLVATGIDVASPSWIVYPWLAGVDTITELMPMGALLSDLDADGRQDLVLSLTAPYEIALFGRPDGGFVDRSIDVGLQLPQLTPRPASPWGIVDPDLDRDGDGDLVVAIGDDATNYALASGAPVRMALYRHGPRGHVEVAQVAGLDAIGSWHAVVPTDLDGDGDADLGLAGYGAPPRLYRNDLPGGGGIALRLVGTTSNHLGYGATVDVDVPGRGVRSQVVVRPGQFEALPEPVVFAGLGAATEATVRVRWPSGVVQVVEHVAAGPTTLVEPESITVDPPTRHLPADGLATATIRVTPRLPDGAIDTAAQVVVVVEGGALEGPAVRDGDAWVARVRAPAAVGRARVEVRVDGVALGVRPILWWDQP